MSTRRCIAIGAFKEKQVSKVRSSAIFSNNIPQSTAPTHGNAKSNQITLVLNVRTKFFHSLEIPGHVHYSHPLSPGGARRRGTRLTLLCDVAGHSATSAGAARCKSAAPFAHDDPPGEYVATVAPGTMSSVARSVEKPPFLSLRESAPRRKRDVSLPEAQRFFVSVQR